MTSSAQATTAAAVDGPLSLVDLEALLRAAASICQGIEGSGHNILTATDTVRDRVRCGTGFPELAGVEIGEGARFQAAAALCRAVFGRVPDAPVAAALRWQSTINNAPALILKTMLETAAGQVAIEVANARAAALLGFDGAVLNAVDERP